MTAGHTRCSFSYFFFRVVVWGEKHRRACACVCVRAVFFVCACASRTGVLELLRVHAVSPADSEMDVRFFPAPPSSVGSCTLPADSGLDYYHPNKVTALFTSFFFSFFVCLSVLCFILLYHRCAGVVARKLLKHKRLPKTQRPPGALSGTSGGEGRGTSRGAVNSAVFGSSPLENKHLLTRAPLR